MENIIRNYKVYKNSQILTRVENPVKVEKQAEYVQIGIRSHAKGIFIKEPVVGKELGNKRVFWIEEDCFIVNIVFAWERAIAQTNSELKGLIASHRFPMYRVDNSKVDLDYFTRLYQTNRGKYLLELASPGGAGRNKTLGQKEFNELEIKLPSLETQKYVSRFLNLLDRRIEQQKEKVEAWREYKKGMMQKLFSRELRFKDENGQEFSEWEEQTLGSLGQFSKGGGLSKADLTEEGIPCILYGELYTLYDHVINKVYSRTKSIDNVVTGMKNDVLIPSSGETAIDIACASSLEAEGVLLGGDINIFRPNTNILGSFISYQINSAKKNELAVYAQGSSVVHLYNKEIKNLKVFLPLLLEQQKIVNFLSEIDKKINGETEKITILEEQKKGFMQQMFI
ncbi:restriction endonuclease subunit S [Sporosarcina beigongshangi]|uniref:restriction endonuclease subunit S n=1 Tax=Sporosarcina beigongshangi TaxID=2782538 RepID=UPI00193A1F65|nr:restriction endonuclease subunit S [Sporosarcina beigongshangi]